MEKAIDHGLLDMTWALWMGMKINIVMWCSQHALDVWTYETICDMSCSKCG